MRGLLLGLALTLMPPAYAGDVITTLSESRQEVVTHVIRNRWGITKEVKILVTHYVYLTQNGDKIDETYKIKSLIDSRPFWIKHSLVKKVGLGVIKYGWVLNWFNQ